MSRKMKLILVKDPDVARQLLIAGERRIKFSGVEFFGPYDALQLAPVRRRIRAVARQKGRGATVCFIDAEIETIELVDDMTNSS